MTYTLYDATLDLAKKLMDVHEGAATTTGSTTSLTDSRNAEPADFYNDGTIWVPARTGPPAYVAQYSRVSDFGTGAFTFDAITGAIASGNLYAAAPGVFPLYMLKQLINRALIDLGPYPFETTFTAVAKQESYSPTDCAAIANEILEVHEATNLSSPLNYVQNFYWRQVPGSTRTLEFFANKAPSTATTIRLVYLDHHSVLTDVDDVIDEGKINKELLTWKATELGFKWLLRRTGRDEMPDIAGDIKDAEQQVYRWQMLKPIENTPAPKLARY